VFIEDTSDFLEFNPPVAPRGLERPEPAIINPAPEARYCDLAVPGGFACRDSGTFRDLFT
jgi:hypothetical protein